MLTTLPVGRGRVAVIGAGLAGLTAATTLARHGAQVVLFECGSHVGGLASSQRDAEGFTHDVGAHFITNRLAAAIGVSAACRNVKRYGESVFIGGKAISYPLGLMCEPRYVAAALRSKFEALHHSQPARNAAEEVERRYGRALARDIALPLIEAWSGLPAERLSPHAVATIPSAAHSAYLSLATRVTGRAIACGYSHAAPENTSVWHVYPSGGLSVLCERLAEDFAGRIELDSPVEEIVVSGGNARAVVVRGVCHEVDAVVSTLPLAVLGRLVTGTDVALPLRRFRYRPMTFVTLRFRGTDLLPDVVTWTPEAHLPFFRLTEAPGAVPWLAPAGMTSITADIGCEVGDAVWSASDDVLAARVLHHLRDIVPGAESRVLGAHVARTPIAYPVFDLAYERERLSSARSLGIGGLVSVGRNGEFAHLLMEDVYWRTLAAMQPLLATFAVQAASR
jgi:oxygen-dependent protoporphyrinogen oxidase